MMKTTGRTNKMSKRFLALGLTLSLIFGMTLTAYASEEGEGGGTTPEVTAPAASENQTPAEPSAAVQEIAAVQVTAQEAYDDNGNVTAETMQGTGSGLVNNAEVAVFEILPQSGEVVGNRPPFERMPRLLQSWKARRRGRLCIVCHASSPTEAAVWQKASARYATPP